MVDKIAILASTKGVDSKRIRLSILSALKTNIPNNIDDNFQDKFTDGLIQAPVNDYNCVHVKWNIGTNNYDASNINANWVKRYPEMVGYYKQFIDDVNIIKNLDPFAIQTYQVQVDKFFYKSSLVLLFLAVVISFTLSYFIKDAYLGQKFWPAFIFVW